MLKNFFVIVAVCIVGTVLWLWPKAVTMPEPESKDGAIFATVPPPAPIEEPVVAATISVGDVPFTAQAPYGEWNDPLFQNGCEEAALAMAAYWFSGQPLSKEKAKQEIIALSKYEEKKFGHAVDTSAADTEKLLRAYYHITTSEVRTDVILADIVEALASGAIIIVPVDGRALKNPHFTRPGPKTHMLLIIGYDAVTQEFITNDPGTKYGQGYRYDRDILYRATRDYPTGDHLPINNVHKTMIVIQKV